MPEVSVLIPARNAAAHIDRALDDATRQTLQDIEILVVDDGSTDDTASIVRARAAADGRIRLWSAKGVGPGAARNIALDAAKGRWIAPLDADDGMAPHRLAELVRTADAVSADLMADNQDVLDLEVGARRRAFASPPTSPFGPIDPLTFIALDDTDGRTLAIGYAKPLIRRAFLVQHHLRYTDDILVAEDFDLYLRALMAGARLFLLDMPLYRYVRSPDGQSRRNASFSLRQVLAANERLVSFARGRGDLDIVHALERRAKRARSHAAFLEFKGSLAARRYAMGLRQLATMSSRRYAARRMVEFVWRRFGLHRQTPG